MLNCLPLLKELISGLLDLLLAVIADLESLDDFPLSISACNWEREDESLWHSIRVVIRRYRHACPSARAVDPVPDVLDGRVTS